ncbi:MAG: 4-hydroxy-3-methylbut-2-enyl diphosphate reductase [Thermoleophilia bacterium]
MSPLTIRVSDSAGFCWGVQRALEVAKQAAAEAEGPIHTLGPIIHNPAVISDLAARGIDVIEDVEEKTAGTVIIRSHGVAKEALEQLEARALAVVDATCTFVKKAQEKAARLKEQGYLVVVLGEPDHPEVLGIRSYAGPDSLVVEGAEDLPAQLPKRRIGVVVQTTQSQERLAALVAALAPRVRELLVYNTICSATEKRQRAATAMAREVDVVVVVGGKNSANTTRLAELCRAVQPRTHHVESAEEIRPEWLEDARSVGVTAGASTPRGQIEAVVRRLEKLAP